MVVGDHNPQRARGGHGAAGTTAVSAVPFPGADCTSRVPPTAAIRSRSPVETAGPVDACRLEPAAVVGHVDLQCPGVELEGDGGVLRVAVLERVGQCLADGEVRGALQARGQPALAHPGADGDVDRDRELGGPVCDRGDQTLVGERGLVDPRHQLAQVPQGVAGVVVQGGQGVGRVGRGRSGRAGCGPGRSGSVARRCPAGRRRAGRAPAVAARYPRRGQAAVGRRRPRGVGCGAHRPGGRW